MAKQEWSLRGDAAQLMDYLDNRILHGSMTASMEDSCAYEVNGVRCFLRVYERYSVIGSNRVSLSVMAIQHESNLQLTAISSGGSQAMVLKMNTMGEYAFLEQLADAVEHWCG